MIKVIFKCENCGHTEGSIVTWDYSSEVECKNCFQWETMKDDTDTDTDTDTDAEGVI